MGAEVGAAAAGLDAARRRARWLLVGGAALGSTATVIANTVVVIAAHEMLHDTVLVGATVSAGIVGAAIGTSSLATIMVRTGRRVGLGLGYSLGAIGALVAAWAILEGQFPVLLVGMLLLGATNASSQLSRYASAVMAPSEARASAIGIVVWAATAGAILGPILIPATAAVSGGLDLGDAIGPFLVAALATALAAVLITWQLRPDPDELAVVDETAAASDADAPASDAFSMRSILRRPAVSVALVSMVIGQVVMIVIMAMTPVHMSEHGHGLGAVGFVISAHVLGMFALSPLTGRIADRIGASSTILLGLAVLAIAAILAAVAPPDGGIVLLVALFLLGYGWNLGFVAGSALLTSALEPSERTRAQGYADSLVWGSSAVASLSSGFILWAAGYAALGVIGALVLIVPLVAVLAWRRRPPVAPPPAPPPAPPAAAAWREASGRE